MSSRLTACPSSIVCRSAAVASASRPLVPGLHFGPCRRSVGKVLPFSACWIRGLTSRSSGRGQRWRPASPARHRAAPLNSRSVSPRCNSLDPSPFLFLFAGSICGFGKARGSVPSATSSAQRPRASRLARSASFVARRRRLRPCGLLSQGFTSARGAARSARCYPLRHRADAV